MAETRVFMSSTCYDLSLLRSQLRIFIKNMGYEPIMSDYEDILYDPRIHTHTSCVDEVQNCDILVLIIGSRFGGKATPEALNRINFDVLNNETLSVDVLKEKECLSVTKLEVLKAIENAIPVYTFIDKRVWHDHALYEKNKASGIADQIVFPSIEKQETAKYIFNFINFVRLRTRGNNIFTFEKGQDIEDTLKKQWSGYFQRLLQEQRFTDNNQKKMDILGEQFEDLKTAILSSIENVDQRETARGIVRYRRLSEILFGLRFSPQHLISANISFKDLLSQHGIVDIIDSRDVCISHERPMMPRSLLIKEDGTFFESRVPKEVFLDFEMDWDSFKQLQPKVKEIILDTLSEMYRPTSLIRYRSMHIEDYLHEYSAQISGRDE